MTVPLDSIWSGQTARMRRSLKAAARAAIAAASWVAFRLRQTSIWAATFTGVSGPATRRRVCSLLTESTTNSL